MYSHSGSVLCEVDLTCIHIAFMSNCAAFHTDILVVLSVLTAVQAALASVQHEPRSPELNGEGSPSRPVGEGYTVKCTSSSICGYHSAVSALWGIEAVPDAAARSLWAKKLFKATVWNTGSAFNTLAHSLAGREPSGAMITIRMQMGQYQQSCLPHEDLYFMRLSLSDSGLTFCASSWHPGLLQRSACQQTDHAHG